MLNLVVWLAIVRKLIVMTDEIKLRELGLDDADIEHMRDLGYKIQKFSDVTSARELQAMYDELGYTEKANDLTDTINATIDGIVRDVQDVTGVTIAYNPNLYNGRGGWTETSTGQFIGKFEPDIEWDRTDFDSYVIDKLSKWIE